MSSINSFYNIGSNSGAEWINDSEFVYISTSSGVGQIWRTDIHEKCPKQITNYSERVWKVHPAPNGKDLFFTMDLGGNEQEQIYLLKDGETEAINLTNNIKARYQFGGVTPDGKTLVYSSNERCPANFDICKMDIATGEKTIVIQNSDSYNMPAALSPNGRYFLYNKLKALSDNYIWMADLETNTAEKIDGDIPFSQYSAPAWVSDSSGFYLTTDAGSEYKYLAYYDIATKTLRKIYEEDWDIEKLALSSDNKYLAMFINRNGYSELEIMNTESENFIGIAKPPKGLSDYYGMSWSSKGHKFLMSVNAATRPADVWLVDVDHDITAKMTTNDMGDIDTDALVEPTLHHFNSFDGLTVPYWYYKAKNANGAVVIDVHGGPEAQERPMFKPLAQYLLSQGFSIVAPNIRGSVGYGKAYTHLDDVEKRMDSVADMDELYKHLVATGKADKDRVAVMGGSYGGYMTLSCITAYPQNWAAAVDSVGMSNLETFLENTSEYRRSHRESEYGSLAKHRDVLRRVSPIHKVDQICAPLMVIHGANDPRVPVTEAEQIVASLKSRNVPVEYLCYPDEGHGLSKRKNQLDCYPKVVEFFKKHLCK